MEFIDGRHYDVKLSELERKTIRLWIDASATYPGTYAALGAGMVRVRFPIRMLVERCGGCHVTNPRQRSRSKPLLDFETTCNLSRPARSKLLRAPLAKSAGGLGKCGEDVFADTDDPCYRGILRALEAAGERLKEEKRFDMPGFRPDVAYVREMKRFGILPADVKPDDPIDVYQTDRDYWRSFWYVPEPTETEPATGPEPSDPRDFPPFDPRNPFRRRGM